MSRIFPLKLMVAGLALQVAGCENGALPGNNNGNGGPGGLEREARVAGDRRALRDRGGAGEAVKGHSSRRELQSPRASEADAGRLRHQFCERGYETQA